VFSPVYLISMLRKSQVMIVNVNPYDTGYDENSHVMKFAALAREVYTTASAPARVPSPMKFKLASTSKPKKREPEIVPRSLMNSKTTKRKVTIEGGDKGRKSEAILEVLEGVLVCSSGLGDTNVGCNRGRRQGRT
jgi:kinesin family protein 20